MRTRWILVTVGMLLMALSIGGPAEATFPGTNGRLVYTVRTKPYNLELYSVAADGSDMVQLTSTARADEETPEISADGTKIVFARTDREGRKNITRIYTMNIDGTGLERLTDGSRYDHDPTWSPDGKKIAYVSASGGKYDIWTMKANGRGKTQITTTKDNYDPDWSPDGARIAFETFTNIGQFNIATIASDGSDVQDVAATAYYEENPSWSPDGTRIAFDRYDDTAKQIFTAAPDGSDLVQVTDTATNSTDAAWAPDGTKLAFVSHRTDIWTIEADGTDSAALIATASMEYEPTWGATP